MKKNYIYARTACRKQLPESRDTIALQVNRCHEYIYKKGLEKDLKAVCSELHSGSRLSAKLRQIVSEMKPGDRLIVDNPSRLSRDFASFVSVTETLTAKSCELVFARNKLVPNSCKVY